MYITANKILAACACSTFTIGLYQGWIILTIVSIALVAICGITLFTYRVRKQEITSIEETLEELDQTIMGVTQTFNQRDMARIKAQQPTT